MGILFSVDVVEIRAHDKSKRTNIFHVLVILFFPISTM